MDYFMIKQSGTIVIPRESKLEAQKQNVPPRKSAGSDSPIPSSPDISVRPMSDISSLDRFDYISAETLLSDRLKLLFEQYLIDQDWKPCVFIDQEKKLQKTFWFLPPLPYQPSRIIYASNGLPAYVYIEESDFARKSPGIFRIRSHKGPHTVIVHLSVAESILRRGICGLELVRLEDR